MGGGIRRMIAGATLPRSHEVHEDTRRRVQRSGPDLHRFFWGGGVWSEGGVGKMGRIESGWDDYFYCGGAYDDSKFGDGHDGGGGGGDF